jgi:RNA polymerase sigma factor (sigma-70 family)
MGGAMSAGGRVKDADQLSAELDARFRAPLMAYFLRRVANRSEAEDLTQETFVRLIGATSFTQADQVNAYVFRVASNLLRDRVRTKLRWDKHQISAIDPMQLEDIASGISEDRSPERVLIGRESLMEVLQALDELGERTKNVYILFRLEGMKQKEIAAIYGIGLSTVEKYVMAAVLHLSKRFGPRV